MLCTPALARAVSLFLAVALAHGEAGSPAAITNNQALALPPAIVIGFVGGFVNQNASAHSTVQVVDHLRNEYPAGVYVEAFENHRRQDAYREILRRLDLNKDGTLSTEEKRNARIIIFGHSWGASETVELARQLEKDGIPVILTIQVDSVSKRGENDAVIPANVSQAANFYQLDGMLHGRPEIRAANASRTRILGNFRSDYKAKPFSCGQYPWWDRLIMKPHIQIECDPAVWNQVE